MLNEVYSDYQIKNPMNNGIILIDIKKDDKLIYYNVLLSVNPLEIFYKKPDCYFIDNERIVYIYTENYSQSKDSLYLYNLFNCTLTVLNQTNYKDSFNCNVVDEQNFNFNYISWYNDSIKTLKGVKFQAKELFNDRLPLQYEFRNDKLYYIKTVQKVLYPDTSYPKGVNLFRKIRGFPHYFKE
jgi:hypothetical protein